MLFAFAFHCFHSALLGRLRESGLAEVVMQCGNGIDREDVPPVEVPIGAPPLMDDLCVPLMDDCPGRLLRKVVQAAKILEATASDFGFAIQYGVGKTEAIVAIRGKGKKAVMDELAAHTEGVGLARVSVLRISLG